MKQRSGELGPAPSDGGLHARLARFTLCEIERSVGGAEEQQAAERRHRAGILSVDLGFRANAVHRTEPPGDGIIILPVALKRTGGDVGDLPVQFDPVPAQPADQQPFGRDGESILREQRIHANIRLDVLSCTKCRGRVVAREEAAIGIERIYAVRCAETTHGEEIGVAGFPADG